MIDVRSVKLKVENIVASVDLFTPLNLEKIMVILPNSKYNPAEFPGIIYHPYGSGIALLIFSSGKLVVTGAKSVEDVEKTVSELVKTLFKIGVRLHCAPEIVLQNMVFSGDLGMKFNLDAIALVLPNCEYEPEMFPGVIYRVKEPKAVILLFTTGRIVCSGVKSEHDAWRAIIKLLRELEKYGVIG